MGIDAIEEFRKSHGINTKGNLAGILQLNRAFSKDTFCRSIPMIISRVKKDRSKD